MARRKHVTPMCDALRSVGGRLGLGQRALGGLIDVTRGTINAWEMAMTLIPMDQRKRLLDELRPLAPRDSWDRE